MEYESQEGVHYITDLYQVVGTAHDAESEDIAKAIRARMAEYHPDRLQGLAPEFQAKGERMARLLNHARTILSDPQNRAEYDAILSAWDGPISTDGTPVMRINDMVRLSMAGKSIKEIEAAFTTQRKQAIDVTKHHPRQQALLGRMFAEASGDDVEDLRAAYDAALFAEDQVLAIEEAERGGLLGLNRNERYEAGIGYGDAVHQAIEGARAEWHEDYQRRKLGGVGVRLAILAGDTHPDAVEAGTLEPQAVLPHYFESMAQKVIAIAQQREAILKKRLEIFQPTYPVAEIQTEGKPYFAIGITNDDTDTSYAWIGFAFDADTVSLGNIEIPGDMLALLTNGDYEQAYHAGFNVLTFATKDHIELNTLLEEAYNKHLRKYFPASLG